MHKPARSKGETLKLNVSPLLRAVLCPIKTYAENEVPQPQPPVALGFSNVKPEPIMFVV